jgi:hypothetical protein
MAESEFYEWKRLASERILAETAGMSLQEVLAYWQAKEAQREELHNSWRAGTAIGSHWNDDVEPWEQLAKPVHERKVS